MCEQPSSATSSKLSSRLSINEKPAYPLSNVSMFNLFNVLNILNNDLEHKKTFKKHDNINHLKHLTNHLS